MKAVRTDTRPLIDGKIDESCWSKAEMAIDFTDYKLERLAVEQTIVRVLYDDENLYVAFECLEPDPNSIVAIERKYDLSLSDEDSATVRFDTFHDHRCTYIFSVNTLGTRYDARMGLFDHYDDATWGCDWTAACTVEKDRWYAEMAIPISNMLFDRRDATTWGASFYRREKGLQERSYWCYRNSRARYPIEYGHLTGLDLANVQLNRKPAFAAYGSATSDFEDNSTKLSTGLDISMKLSSETQVYENDNHDTTLRDFMEGGGVGLRNEIELWYIRSDRFHTPFQNYSDRIRVEYNEEVDVWHSITGGVAKGVYEEEPYYEYSLEEPMRITNRLVTTLNGNYCVKEPEAGGHENIWLWRWVTQYNFVWNARIKFTAEQTSEDRHNLTMLFSWPMKQNTDLYVLFNDYEIDGEKVRAAFVKMVYRF